MKKPTWTSRERMQAALDCQTPDHTPCAFMMYKGLKDRCADSRAFILAQLDLGLDTVLELPIRPPVVVNDHTNLHGLPVSYDPRVRTREWLETKTGEGDVLIKEYTTPGGSLRVEVQKTSHWPWGEHVPFLDDHLVPRSRKYLVEHPEDLEALSYLLTPPTPAEVDSYRRESAPYLQLAVQNGLLVAGGWGVGADLIGWICGLKNMIFMTYRQPDFLRDLLGLISTWNRTRMEAAFTLPRAPSGNRDYHAGTGTTTPLDLYIKRAWYENCDFWTPAAWQEFILPLLTEEVRLAHQAGVKFGYLITSNAMPLVESIIAAGVDVLIGVDPRQYDLERLARQARGRLCLWGGVNSHLTIERGSPADVESEVARAMQILAPQGGFILSPVDNVREDSAGIEANVKRLIQSWEQRR
jgi:hypothetical protein